MIEEVVNSILEAEDVAEKRIAEAKAKANEIVEQAEDQAAKERSDSSLQTKQAYEQGLKEIEQQSGLAAREKLAQLNAQTDSEKQAYAKNVDKAVKIIVEQLL